MPTNFHLVCYCITAVTFLAILVLGPAACTIDENRNITARVASACSGDFTADPGRAATCALALTLKVAK
jgi:hypothetical protein